MTLFFPSLMFIFFFNTFKGAGDGGQGGKRSKTVLCNCKDFLIIPHSLFSNQETGPGTKYGGCWAFTSLFIPVSLLFLGFFFHLVENRNVSTQTACGSAVECSVDMAMASVTQCWASQSRRGRGAIFQSENMQ